MIFRALITSGIISWISYLTLYFSGLSNSNFSSLNELLIFWLVGFLSILGFFYGKRIKRSLQRETGTIKWFDPSKGYGFLVRDKGGDLFVHLRAIKPEDRRKVRENSRVKFSIEDSEKGPEATRITII
tara:strand:- start:2431 stop:2814 length:384 start_codon:yes stop_codon:yes gene_type:complete